MQGTKVAANIAEIRDYLDSFTHGDEMLSHLLSKSLTDVLSRYQPALRPANDNEKPEFQSTIIKELSTGVLGEHYIFDPTLDPHLDQKIRNIADFITAAIKISHDWNKATKNSALAPSFLKETFLIEALSPELKQKNSQENHRTSLTSLQELDTALEKTLRRVKALEELTKSSVRHVNNNAPSNNADEIEKVMDLKDGWSVHKYKNLGTFIEDHKSLNYCFGEHLDLSNFYEFSNVYYSLCNPHGEPQAIFEVKNGVNELMRYYGSGGHPPSDECINRAIPFIKKKSLLINSYQDTGLYKANGEYVNIYNTPNHIVTLERLHLDKTDRPFAFTNIKEISGSYRYSDLSLKQCSGIETTGSIEQIKGDFSAIDCNNFSSLAKLKEVWGSVNIKNCQKFTSMGNAEHLHSHVTIENAPNLESLGGLKTVGGRLVLKDCANLKSLGDLEQVKWGLDIRGTAIKELPNTLKHVEGPILTDAGEFSRLWFAKRALKKYHAQKDSSNNSQLPDFSGGMPPGGP
jgi:hypothetical protein